MDKHIFLIGMMGCGKSTVGRRLSALLSCAFTDLDDAIEAHEGLSIPDAIRQLRILEDCVSTSLKNAEQGERQAEQHNRLCRQTFHTMLYGLIART